MTDTDTTNTDTRVLLGVRGLTPETGQSVANHLLSLEGISKAVPDTEQIEVHYDPRKYTVMDLVREVRSQGFLAGML